jgi:hypothetical protein
MLLVSVEARAQMKVTFLQGPCNSFDMLPCGAGAATAAPARAAMVAVESFILMLLCVKVVTVGPNRSRREKV